MDHLRTYFEVYSEGLAGRISSRFLSYDQRLDSIQKFKAQLPKGFVLLSDQPKDFSNFKITVVPGRHGYYAILSIPIGHEDYVFKAFRYIPQPIFWQDHLLQIKLDNDVLAISVKNENLFVETSIQQLASECLKFSNKYVCPRISKFKKDKEQSCIYNLKKPSIRQNQDDLGNLCDTYIIPKKEFVVEYAPLCFQFYYPISHSVTIYCNGEDHLENLDMNNQLILEDESCEIHLQSEIIRSMRQIGSPTTKNAYKTFSTWFDSTLAPIQQLIPENPVSPVNVKDLLTYDNQWRTLHHHHYQNKYGIVLYVCVGICFLVLCFIVFYFYKKYKSSTKKTSEKSQNGIASAPPSYGRATGRSHLMPTGSADTTD